VASGTNLTSAFYYNNRLQPCRSFITTGAGTPANCADSSVTGNIMDFTYGFNLSAGDNGNLASLTNKRDTTRNQSFTYDSLNRIATAQTSATTGTKCFGESFTFDSWANLLTIGGLTGYSGCTQQNLAVSATVKNQISANSYDAAGNMTTGGYTYDAENRLLTGGGLTYTYDGDGKRVQKSSSKLYWYGMGADALDETDSTGSTSNSAFNEYVFFTGKRLARRNSSNTVFYYFTDHLSTSRAMVQGGQTTVCYDADFYPFGGERTPITNTCPQNYKFTGKERDTETGLDYFGARYYSSGLGRWLTPDWAAKAAAVPYAEFADPQSLNLYTYVRNIPTSKVDPDGHDPDPDPNCPSCHDLLGDLAATQPAPRVEPVPRIWPIPLFPPRFEYRPHRSKKSKAKEPKHQEGEARKKRDIEDRTPRRPPEDPKTGNRQNPPGGWPPKPEPPPTPKPEPQPEPPQEPKPWEEPPQWKKDFDEMMKELEKEQPQPQPEPPAPQPQPPAPQPEPPAPQPDPAPQNCM
jgi:RHS repeat-associated protein